MHAHEIVVIRISVCLLWVHVLVHFAYNRVAIHAHAVACTLAHAHTHIDTHMRIHVDLHMHVQVHAHAPLHVYTTDTRRSQTGTNQPRNEHAQPPLRAPGTMRAWANWPTEAPAAAGDVAVGVADAASACGCHTSIRAAHNTSLKPRMLSP